MYVPSGYLCCLYSKFRIVAQEGQNYRFRDVYGLAAKTLPIYPIRDRFDFSWRTWDPRFQVSGEYNFGHLNIEMVRVAVGSQCIRHAVYAKLGGLAGGSRYYPPLQMEGIFFSKVTRSTLEYLTIPTAFTGQSHPF